MVITKVFTFGAGQAYEGCYVEITTPLNNHRELMLKVHGQHWSMMYDRLPALCSHYKLILQIHCNSFNEVTYRRIK